MCPKHGEGTRHVGDAELVLAGGGVSRARYRCRKQGVCCQFKEQDRMYDLYEVETGGGGGYGNNRNKFTKVVYVNSVVYF